MPKSQFDNIFRPQSIETPKFRFESVTDRSELFRLPDSSEKHDYFSIFPISQDEPADLYYDLPILGAEIGSDPDFWVDDTVRIATDLLPEKSKTGYQMQLLKNEGSADYLSKYPVLVATGTDKKDSMPTSEAVVAWVSSMAAAELFPIIPPSTRSEKITEIGEKTKQLGQNKVALCEKFQVPLTVFALDISIKSLPADFLEEALLLKSEDLYLLRLTYGHWIAATRMPDQEIANKLMNELKLVLIGNETVAGATGVSTIFSANQEFEDIIQIIKSYKSTDKMFDVPSSGLFAELEGFNLTQVMLESVKNSIKSGEVSETDATNIKNIFIELTSILGNVDLERAVFILQPLWNILEKSLSLKLISDIKLDLQNNNQELASKLYGFDPFAS